MPNKTIYNLFGKYSNCFRLLAVVSCESWIMGNVGNKSAIQQASKCTQSFEVYAMVQENIVRAVSEMLDYLLFDN